MAGRAGGGAPGAARRDRPGGRPAGPAPLVLHLPAWNLFRGDWSQGGDPPAARRLGGEGSGHRRVDRYLARVAEDQGERHGLPVLERYRVLDEQAAGERAEREGSRGGDRQVRDLGLLAAEAAPG